MDPQQPAATPPAWFPWATVHGAVPDSYATEARFTEAYEQHRDHLVGWLRARTRDEAAAEDISQEAYLRLLCQLRQGTPPDDVAAWLNRVALNLLISGARHARVVRARTPIPRETDGGDPTVELVIARERFGELGRGLHGVPAPQRTILAMAAAGMTTAQISVRLGTREGAARTRLHRARRALCEQVDAA